MSSQFVTMPCSMGYLRVRIPLLLWASSPTYESFWPIPTITPWCLGRPTMEGNTARGASSPAKPALHIPEPLSTTKAATSSSAISLELLEAEINYRPTRIVTLLLTALFEIWSTSTEVQDLLLPVLSSDWLKSPTRTIMQMQQQVSLVFEEITQSNVYHSFS